MKITVIGGSGFIGSHVSDALSKKGHKVKIFDKKKSKWKRADQILIKGNIFDYKSLDKAIKGADIVYNFAALVDLDKALRRPIETAKSNILGTVNALEISRKHNVKRFVYASTIYANSREGGFYRCSKKAAEDYVEEFHNIYGLNYTVLRYGSIYGDRSDNSNGVTKIITNAMKTRKISYFGNKKAVREYIHVTDVAKASIKILSEKFKNKYLILSGRKSIKVATLLKILANILNISGKIQFRNEKFTGHYVVKPFLYKPKLGEKLILKSYADFQKNLKDLVNIIKKQK